MSTNAIQTQNKMSAKSLVANCGDQLHIKQRTKMKDGKEVTVTFFVCGDTIGYVSKSAVAELEAGGSIDRLQYAEVKSAEGQWIPTLMSVGKGIADKWTLG